MSEFEADGVDSKKLVYQEPTSKKEKETSRLKKVRLQIGDSLAQPLAQSQLITLFITIGVACGCALLFLPFLLQRHEMPADEIGVVMTSGTVVTVISAFYTGKWLSNTSLRDASRYTAILLALTGATAIALVAVHNVYWVCSVFLLISFLGGISQVAGFYCLSLVWRLLHLDVNSMQIVSCLTLFIWGGMGGTCWSMYWGQMMGAESSAVAYYVVAYGTAAILYSAVVLHRAEHQVTDFVTEEVANGEDGAVGEAAGEAHFSTFATLFENADEAFHDPASTSTLSRASRTSSSDSAGSDQGSVDFRNPIDLEADLGTRRES